MKRVKVKELQPNDVFMINGHRFKVYGRVLRDGQAFVCCYEDRLNHVRKLNYLDFEMEVLIDE